MLEGSHWEEGHSISGNIALRVNIWPPSEADTGARVGKGRRRLLKESEERGREGGRGGGLSRSETRRLNKNGSKNSPL